MWINQEHRHIEYKQQHDQCKFPAKRSPKCLEAETTILGVEQLIHIFQIPDDFHENVATKIALSVQNVIFQYFIKQKEIGHHLCQWTLLQRVPVDEYTGDNC